MCVCVCVCVCVCTVSPLHCSFILCLFLLGGSNITSVAMPTSRMPFQSYISYIESPSKFYIQFAKWESELNLLLEQMYEHYSTAPRVSHTVQPGSMCAALFRDDENWYRARVESLSQVSERELLVTLPICGDVGEDV